MSRTPEERPAAVQPSAPTISQSDVVNKRIARLKRRQQKSVSRRNTEIRKLQAQIDYSLDKRPSIKAVREIDSECFNVRAANDAENLFFNLAKKNGWILTKRGWPDFLGFRNGKIACIEVKQGGQPRKNQKAVLAALSYYGVPCYVWRPRKGFEKVPKPTTEQLAGLIQQAIPPVKKG